MKIFINIIATTFLLLICFVTSQSQTLSFPEALGFGRFATGGRTGTVYHVTNLNDSGAGSLRDAVSVSNRIVVFDVSGYISINTAIVCHSNISILGQTAPGEGIGIKGGELGCAKLSNVICRYLRIRPGSETASSTDDAISIYRSHNVIFDHCSIEFAPWNNIDGVSDDYTNYPVTDITFQNCLIADPTGQQFGAHCESVGSNWSFIYNVFANSHNRNPLAKINNVFVNNVEYNYSAAYTTHTSTSFKHDIVNNYFIFGPASTGTDNTWFQMDKNQSIYYSGNMKDKTLDGTLNGSGTTPYFYQGPPTILSAPWSTITTSLPVYSAATAYHFVSSMAGTFPYDELDKLIISQVYTLGSGTTGYGVGCGPNSSLYTSQAQTGLGNNGYGTIASATKPTDTDNDGMPDFWEKTNSLNINSNEAMTIGSDGYTNIERYANWLGELHAQVNENSYIDIDLAQYTTGFSKVSPSYVTKNAVNGSAIVQSNGHTVRFTPTANYFGMARFSFTVTGNDNTSYTTTVFLAVVPGTSLPTIQQTIVLVKGWNLISINVNPTDLSISTLFSGLDVQEIKTMEAFWRKNQNIVFNSIKTIIAGNGYLVNMNNAGTLTVSGVPLTINNSPFTIKTGWQLIGCPFQTITPFSTYFTTTNCSKIKNFDGFWMPNGTTNSITNLDPGKAYFYMK